MGKFGLGWILLWRDQFLHMIPHFLVSFVLDLIRSHGAQGGGRKGTARSGRYPQSHLASSRAISMMWRIRDHADSGLD